MIVDIAVALLVAACIVFLIAYAAVRIKSWMTAHYVCPACKEDFMPKSTMRFLFSFRHSGYNNLICPKCGHKDMMKGIQS